MREFFQGGQKLYISQPTLSQQIALLEQELGVTLFLRGNRKVELTSAGQLFLQHANTIHSEIDRLYNDMNHLANPQRNSIRLGVIWSFGVLGYVDPLNAFMIDQLDASISLVTDSSEVIHEMLCKDELNAGITLILENNLPPGLTYAVPLDQHVLTVGMKPDHPLAAKAFLTPHDLLPYPLIPMDRGSICYGPFSEELNQSAHSFRIICECPFFPTHVRWLTWIWACVS